MLSVAAAEQSEQSGLALTRGGDTTTPSLNGKPKGETMECDLKEVRELGVAVGNMGLLGGQGSKDVPQAGEGLVNAAGLLLMLPLHLTPRQPLAALPTVCCKAVLDSKVI